MILVNRLPFAPDEWYHCYTRGIEKRDTFIDGADYLRFLDLLYLCNSTEPVHRSNIKDRSTVYKQKRPDTLVSIGAYCLMPNHWHILLKEKSDNGISTFMQKLGTGFTMYFNKRHDRIGNLFVKPFRSKHVGDDIFLRQVFAYIHLNPLDHIAPGWKQKAEISKDQLAALEKYQWSSFYEYASASDRKEAVILESSVTDKELLNDVYTPIDQMVNNALAYYQEISR